MSTPPNVYTSEPMWRLWENRPNPAWQLSGIYADKKGYHNTVNANKIKWPTNYSIRFPLDLVTYNRKFARGIDLTMSDSEMIKWTTRMKNSALDPEDTRLAAVREFYGTLDGIDVYGLIKDDDNGPWRSASADDTHLWHGHTGIFTAFVNDWDRLSPLLSVWGGQSFSDWSADMFPVQGTKSEEVSYWQRMHNQVRKTVTPNLPEIAVDGDYGPDTANAFHAWYRACGGTSTNFRGEFLTAFMGFKYQIAFTESIIGLKTK